MVGPMTTGDYLAMPETVRPQELAFGVLHVRESPSPLHQRMVVQLLVALHAHVRSRGLGEVWVAPLDVILDADNALIVQPDLFFIGAGSECVVADRVWGAPELAIEVLSPHPRVGDVEERLGWFAEYGVRECWLVHQLERWVEVVRFGDGVIQGRHRLDRDERIASDVLPEFAESLDSIMGY